MLWASAGEQTIGAKQQGDDSKFNFTQLLSSCNATAAKVKPAGFAGEH